MPLLATINCCLSSSDHIPFEMICKVGDSHLQSNAHRSIDDDHASVTTCKLEAERILASAFSANILNTTRMSKCHH